MDALFAVELDEATLTFQAWQDGLPIEANDKIQPAALLAVRNVVAPRYVNIAGARLHGAPIATKFGIQSKMTRCANLPKSPPKACAR